MNKYIAKIIFGGIVLSTISSITLAKNTGWNASVGVNMGSPVNRPYPQQYPHYPPTNRPPLPPRPPHVIHPPLNNGGVSLTYQAPSYTTYNHQSYTWVNGDPNVAQIKSSEHIVIANWRELGLPQPPSGMYWIFEDGRYILESSR